MSQPQEDRQIEYSTGIQTIIQSLLNVSVNLTSNTPMQYEDVEDSYVLLRRDIEELEEIQTDLEELLDELE